MPLMGSLVNSNSQEKYEQTWKYRNRNYTIALKLSKLVVTDTKPQNTPWRIYTNTIKTVSYSN